MELPFFDGYNIPVEQVIKRIDILFQYVPPNGYNKFMEYLLDHLKGEAQDILQYFIISNHYDLYDALIQVFVTDLIALDQRIRDLPDYNGHCLSEYAEAIENAVAYTPQSHYNKLLDGLWDRSNDRFKEIVAKHGCSDHMQIIEILEQDFYNRTVTDNLDRPTTIELVVPELRGTKGRFLLDTGSGISLIKFGAIKCNTKYNPIKRDNLQGITGNVIPLLGTVWLTIKGKTIEFHIVWDSINFQEDGLLGRNFFTEAKAVLSYQNNTLEIPGIDPIFYSNIRNLGLERSHDRTREENDFCITCKNKYRTVNNAKKQTDPKIITNRSPDRKIGKEIVGASLFTVQCFQAVTEKAKRDEALIEADRNNNSKRSTSYESPTKAINEVRSFPK